MQFDLLLTTFALVVGLAVGSFVNVLAVRVPLRRSIVTPGSACMSCTKPISWYDNVPLLSFALLAGRCRTCRTPIGFRYPATELATALLVVACVLAFGLTGEAVVAAVFCAALVAVTATDLEHRIIPDRISLPAAALVLVAQTALHPSPEWLIGSLGASLFLFAAVVAYPSGMGMGDVKLALLLGAALGRGVAVALAIALTTALIPSVFLLVRHGSAARKMGIPFGPFLALGAIVALFFGEPLLDAYISLL